MRQPGVTTAYVRQRMPQGRIPTWLFYRRHCKREKHRASSKMFGRTVLSASKIKLDSRVNSTLMVRSIFNFLMTRNHLFPLALDFCVGDDDFKDLRDTTSLFVSTLFASTCSNSSLRGQHLISSDSRTSPLARHVRLRTPDISHTDQAASLFMWCRGTGVTSHTHPSFDLLYPHSDNCKVGLFWDTNTTVSIQQKVRCEL